MNFLAGDSEMARRIRDFDWTDHPFGPPSTWPQSLRSALSICLQSSFPTAIYWGGELRLLYNDAWSEIPGPRHPAALGAPAREVWPDIWHIIEPQFMHLIETGEGIFVENQLLPLRRYGAVEETYWNYSFTPIRGEDGAIEGVFNSGSETTDEVLHKRQVQFLLQLNESLRECETAAEARRLAVRLLGEHLGATRAGVREIVLDGRTEHLAVVDEWTAPGAAPVGDRVRIADLGRKTRETLLAGRVFRMKDAETEIDDPAVRAKFAELGIRAALAVPWMCGGRVRAVLFAHSDIPRDWDAHETETLEKVLETTMGWIERERAAEQERIMAREIDHRSRNTLAIVQSLVRLTSDDTVDGFREKIVNRIEALARAHGLLASRRWRDLDLTSLLREELGPYCDSVAKRVKLSGPTVSLDPDFAQMVAMLVHELATNAAKYGALGDPCGTLEVSWRTEGDILELLWAERLVSAPPKAAPRSDGGFGSTLLSRVADQLGGRIDCEHGPQGLRCRLTLPLLRDANLRAASAPSSPSADGEADLARPKRILIVEDEPIVAMDMAETVRALGYEVFGLAPSLAKGLDLLKGRSPDLAIVDADLGGEASTPIAEELSRRGVPFVMVTGYDDVPALSEGGARLTVLSKPISERELGRTLAEIMRADAQAATA